MRNAGRLEVLFRQFSLNLCWELFRFVLILFPFMTQEFRLIPDPRLIPLIAKPRFFEAYKTTKGTRLSAFCGPDGTRKMAI